MWLEPAEVMQLRTEVEIGAPAERVWRVLTDFSGYSQWNPFIPSADGELAEGAPLKLELASSEGTTWREDATLVVVKPPLELRWRTRLWFRGLLDGEHFVTLSELDATRTRLVQGQDLGGLFVRFSGNRITQIARGCVGMNQALKRRVELSS